MMLTDTNTIQIAVAAAVAAFLGFLLLYAIGSLFSRNPREDGVERGADRASHGPSYAEIAARDADGFVAKGDEPEFQPAPDYASCSFEIPAGASYTQVAVATAAARQRGLKPKLAGGHAAHAADAKSSAPSPAPKPLQSYTAIALETVGEPLLKSDIGASTGVSGASRVDYSAVDLSGLQSYTAIAVAIAREKAAQQKMLH